MVGWAQGSVRETGKVKFGSLFTGIGGLDLALESFGHECLWQVEIDPYARGVLEHHWPGVERFTDVRTVGATNLRAVDCVVGGFPCQDISVASHTATGLDGERSGLWSEFARIVGELRPRVVFVENSPALTVRGLYRILGDLTTLDFDAEGDVFSASEVGAPHERERLFILAHTNGIDRAPRMGRDTRPGALWASDHGDHAARRIMAPAAPREYRKAHGLPAQVDRLRCLGNAVVPAQAALAWSTLMSRIAA